MSTKVVVAGTVSIDTGNSKTELNDLNKRLDQTKGNLKETGTAATKTGKEVESSGGSFGKLKDKMTGLPGPLGQASEGVGKLSGAFKALLANPVGLVLAAIVGVLVLLYKAFTNTFAGGQKMEQVFAGIKAAGQALLDNLERIGSAIVKLFSFDFSGAVDEIKGVAKAAGDAYNKMADLTKAAQKLAREQADNDFDAIKRQAKLAELREKVQDKDISAADRKKAAQDLLKESEENAKADLELAKQTAENKIAQLTLEKDGADKNYQEIRKIQGEQVQGEIENANELKNVRKIVNGADREIAAEEKQRHTEAIARAKELRAAQVQAEKERLAAIEKEIDAARKKRDLDLENAGAQLKDLEEQNAKAAAQAVLDANTEIDPNLIRAKNAVLANAIIKQDEEQKTEYVLALAEREASGRIALLGGISNALGQLSELAGKKTAVGKALAIAQTTIDTYTSAIAAFKSLAPIPYVGPILGGIAAAAAIANGIAAVKKIVAVQVPGGGSGGGAVPTGLPVQAAPVAPTTATTQLPQDQLNQIGNATNSVKAYVVESDIGDARERTERLNRAARLGG